MKTVLTTAVALFAAVNLCFTQITVDTTTYSSDQLVSDILFGPGCMVPTNITYTGDNAQLGYITDATSSIGFGSGIIISTGRATLADGAPGSFADFAFNNYAGNPGDADLNNLLGANNTYDAGVIEFDIIAQSNTLSFNYIFASEEYPEYVCSQFNDIFGLFISGPGIAGQQNMAQLPGGAGVVAINNVNNGYADGFGGTPLCDTGLDGNPTNPAYYVSNNTDEPTGGINAPNFAYDGYTVVLTASANVTPCQTYHIKIAIADVMDAVFDSAIILEAGSFSNGNGLSINTSTPTTNNDSIPEGCSGSAEFVLGQTSATPTTINYTISGTATNGTDYNSLPGSITIPAGQTTASVNINTILDGLPEGMETVIIETPSGCACDPNITAQIEIFDIDPLQTQLPDQSACGGQPITLSPTYSGGYGNYSFSWNTGETTDEITVSPTSNTSYTFTLTDDCGASISVTNNITISSPVANIAIPDTLTCNTTQVTLDASGSTGANDFSWTGPGIVSGGNTASPIVDAAGTYTLTYGIAPCTSTETIVVEIDTTTPNVNIVQPADLSCTVNSTTADGSGSSSGNQFDYNWTTTGGNITTGNNSNTATLDAPGVYILTITNNDNGCVAQDSVTVNQTSNYPDPTITAAGPFCIDDPTFALQAATTGGTWSSNNPACLDANGNFTPSTAGAGTTDIYYEVGNGTCITYDTITITVNPLPDATITQAGPFCENVAPATLQAATPGGTWGASVATSIDANGTFTPSSTIGNTDIYYEVTVNGCTNYDTINIVVNPLPDPTITPAGPFCESEPMSTFQAATPGGTWSSLPANNITTTGDFTPSVAGVGSTDIYYEVTVNNCTNYDTTTVTVNSVFDPTITPAGPFCQSNLASQLAAATPGGTWTSNCGPCLSLSGLFNPTSAGAGTHDIIYTIPGNCGSADTIQITVFQDADASITPINPMCEVDNPVTITSVETGGTWSSDCIGCLNAGTGEFDPGIATAGTYEVIYTISGVCGDQDTINVQVNGQLDATITPIGDLCENDPPVQLVVPDAGGVWTSSCGTCIDQSGLFDPGLSGGAPVTVTYVINSACGDSSTININVSPNADASFTGILDICSNATPIQLTSTEAGGTWSGNGITDPTNGLFDPTVSGSGTFPITYTIGGMCGDTQTEIVSVLPPLELIVFQDASICEGGTTSINALASNGDGNYQYNWDNGLGALPQQNVSPNATTVYTMTLTDGCETLQDSVTITVFPNPVVNFTPDILNGCAPLTVEFTEQIGGATSTCIWNFGDGNSSADCGTVSNFYNTPGCYDVSLTIIDDNQCIGDTSFQDLICVYENPTADFDYTPVPLSIFDPTAQFNNLSSTNSVTFDWSFGTNGTLGSDNNENPSFTFPDDQPGFYDVCLIVGTQHQCYDTICQVVEVEDEFAIYVPNAFTPDGDGVNDTFFPTLQGANEDEFKFYIFNRWGELIFEAYHPTHHWDGTYKGVMSQTDVYVWKIETKSLIDDRTNEYIGHVSLVK